MRDTNYKKHPHICFSQCLPSAALIRQKRHDSRRITQLLTSNKRLGYDSCKIHTSIIYIIYVILFYLYYIIKMYVKYIDYVFQEQQEATTRECVCKRQ